MKSKDKNISSLFKECECGCGNEINKFDKYGRLRRFVNGYSMVSRTLSNITKRKISEANIGEKHPFYGKKHTIETRRKMFESKVDIDYLISLRKECDKKIREY